MSQKDEVMEAKIRITTLRKRIAWATENGEPADKFEADIAAIEREFGDLVRGEFYAVDYESTVFTPRPPTYDEAWENVLKAEASGDGKSISEAWNQLDGTPKPY